MQRADMRSWTPALTAFPAALMLLLAVAPGLADAIEPGDYYLVARHSYKALTAFEGDAGEVVLGQSARNRLRGIVTAVVKDTVMAQVDIQSGPFRVVSLMSREAVDDLDLQVGSVAIAVIKSTTVVVERSTPAAAKGRTGS